MTTRTISGHEIDHKLLKQIDIIQLNERLKSLKKRYLGTTPKLASERETYYIQSWRDTEGQPIQLRIARAVKKVLENIPTPIFDNELVVGSITRFFRGSYAMINYDSGLILELLAEAEKGEITMGGVNVLGRLDPKDERALRENSAFFKGKTNRELEEQVCRTLWGSWHDDVTEARGQAAYHYAPPGYGITYYDEVFEKGIKGIITDVREKLAQAEAMGVDDPERLWFWESVILVCEGIINFAKRYAERARELAKKENDPERRKELDEIATVCERVPEHPPESFHEAIQTVSFIELAKVLENGRIGDYCGRLDQCLYP